MKTGKISNTILKRSVLKNIGSGNQYKERKMCPGMGASVFRSDAFADGKRIVMSTESGLEPVIKAANNVWAKGAHAKAVQVSVTLPPQDREIRLKKITAAISADCARWGIDYAGGHTQVSDSVNRTIISATCIGEQREEVQAAYTGRNVKPGDVIALTKWIGIGGIQKIIDEKREEISERYREHVIDTAYGKREFLSIMDEAVIGAQAGATYMLPVSSGGVYAGLWNLSEVTGLGFDVDFRKIPVCQEIIEICEIYDINPYELESSGCLLMTFRPECDMINLLHESGIPVAVIGTMQESNDKMIRNLEEIRYLDMPKCDEVYKIINS